MNNKSATGANTTDAGRECEPAGAREELCRRLEMRQGNYDEGILVAPADHDALEAAALIRRLERERDGSAFLKECAETALRKAEAEAERLRKALNDASKSLEPFADKVFNDNGDMTVHGAATYDDYIDAYFARRRARTALDRK